MLATVNRQRRTTNDTSTNIWRGKSKGRRSGDSSDQIKLLRVSTEEGYASGRRERRGQGQLQGHREARSPRLVQPVVQALHQPVLGPSQRDGAEEGVEHGVSEVGQHR